MSASRANHLSPSRTFQSLTQDLYSIPVRHSSSWTPNHNGNLHTKKHHKPKPHANAFLKAKSNTKLRQETDWNRRINLSCINGLKPKKFLPEGASLFDGSAVITRTGDEYSCTCKSWKDAKAAGIATTCKHLREAFGVQYEAARVKLMKKFRARLPSGLGTVTVPETIAAETKQPDAVVQTTEDTSLLKESEPDRISDVNSNPRSITADSSQNLNVESNAPSTLKEATPIEPVDSVGIAVTDKVSDKSSELEPKPASKKSRKTPAKKPVPQLPHAKSVERDSATTSDLSSESRATGTLQEQEDTPPKEVPAKESKSKEKKQT
ncbi:hypothetical protein HDU81_007466, partial [Chytriomyces hyalinus]